MSASAASVGLWPARNRDKMMVQSTFQHTSALCVRYEPGMGLPGATGWLLPYCVPDYSIFLVPFIFLVGLFPCLSLWGMPLPA